MKPITFTDNTAKNFICVSKAVEPKDMKARINKQIIEHWFDFKFKL